MSALNVVPFPLSTPPIRQSFYVVGNNGYVIVANNQALSVSNKNNNNHSEWKVFNVLDECLENLSCINISKDGILALGTTKGTLEVLLPSGKSLSQKFDEENVVIMRIVFAGNIVFVLGNNGNLCRWDLTTNEIRSLNHKKGIYDIHYSDLNDVYFTSDNQIYKVIGPEYSTIEFYPMNINLRYITSCNGFMYGANDNKLYQLHDGYPVLIEELKHERVIHLLPHYYNYYEVKLAVVLVFTDTDRVHLLRSTSIIWTFDIADLNIRFNEYQFNIENSERKFDEELDCFLSLGVYREYILYASTNSKSISSFVIPNGENLIKELLNNNKVEKVFDVISKTKIYGKVSRSLK